MAGRRGLIVVLIAAAHVVLQSGCGDGVGPGIVVTSPNGGEVWRMGGDQAITWRSVGIDRIKIRLSRDGGGTWETLVGSVGASSGSYAWTVTGAPSPDCVIRLSDASDGWTADTSDSTFAISPFTDTGAGLTGVRFCSLGWGDYDSDGDLDLALAGAVIVSRVSKVYRNDAGSFTDTGAGLTEAYYCSLAWGDYDNDNDVDLAVAGYDDGGISTSMAYRNDVGTLADIGAGLTGVHDCAVAWGDYDNDGDLDLALGGTGASVLVTKAYRNDPATFADSSVGLTEVGNCCLAWGDYDNDGDLDLAVAGWTSTGNVSSIYDNDGGLFTDIAAGLTGVDWCSLAWGDYDSDGDLDLALAGSDGVGPVSKVYRNNAGTFTDIGAGLTAVDVCSLAWGDHDNDGDLDLALAGLDAGLVRVSKIYRNDGGLFTDIRAGLTGVSDCALAWGDYDSDGDLDLALAGRYEDVASVTEIYRNDCAVPNTIPTAPAGLLAAVSGSGPYDVAFSWGPAADGETPQQSLTYNMRVGTTPGGNEVMSGMAIASPDARLIPAMGNVQLNTSWALKGLAAGTYHWSVQAVDTAFAGSAWAAEETLTVP